ncbi:MAG: tetratricopeptide repeat protein [Acidimicrobiia bacterium]|nr:tetratricopeptide repeat protein [Acidimicrobiia bacterium]
MRLPAFALFLPLAATLAVAQDQPTARAQFEAGEYAPVIEAGHADDAAPDVLFLAAQSAQRVPDEATARLFADRLAALPPDSGWHHLGVSIHRMLTGDTAGARTAAQQAIAKEPRLAEAHLQLGLALSRRQEWASAAAAFDKAAELSPMMAYAYYYGGLAYYRAGRPDRMANHFEYFLKLAPDAPERPEVTQIMRTVRGR